MQNTISIENDRFTVRIATRGAELRSFYDKTAQREIMWEADPAIWGGSAPILFPTVGSLRDGCTTIDGTVYEIPKHGVVRTRDAELIELEKNRACFAFTSNEETLRLYPFPFRLEVEFLLEDQELNVHYRVTHTGPRDMLFSIGSHPAFALDLKNAALHDYCIEFNQPESLDLYGLAQGLLAKKQDHYLVDATQIQLSETLFSDDALIFKHIKSDLLRLKSKTETRHLEFKTHGAPHLGLWAKPGAPYVCIEPWFSFDDQPDCDGIFENKPGIITLPANELFSTGYSVRLID